MVGLVDLLGNQRAYRTAAGKGFDEDLVAPGVKFFDLFAMDVDRAAVTQFALQRSSGESVGDSFNGLRYLFQVAIDSGPIRSRVRR